MRLILKSANSSHPKFTFIGYLIMAGVRAVSVYPQIFVTCIVNSERQDLTIPLKNFTTGNSNSNYHAIQKIAKHRHKVKMSVNVTPWHKDKLYSLFNVFQLYTNLYAKIYQSNRKYININKSWQFSVIFIL